MRLKALAIIIFCFLITSSFVLLYFDEFSKASGNEIYVHNAIYAFRDGSAEHPYASIQYAIDLADEGDTIYVFGGNYNETLSLDKRINLVGSVESGNTIISKNEPHMCTIEITADYVTLEGFNISEASNSNQVALIYIGSNSAVIQRNNITYSGTYGIYLDSSDDNTIGSNVINDTKGIYLSSSNNNVIHSNKISNCSEAAVYMEPLDSNNIIYSNNFSYNKYGVYAFDCVKANISNNIMNYNDLDGIKLQSGNNIAIANNVIRSNDRNGISLNCLDAFIDNNTIKNNQKGIDIFGSNCIIKNNTIQDCRIYGIYAQSGSKNNIFYLNKFTDNIKNVKEDGSNQWYYELQGNYWDDYNEVDRNLDGIGDTPYTVSGGGTDLYPLGYFLKPPNKPKEPSPEDGEYSVPLVVTLEVEVTDPDSEKMKVYFYNASTGDPLTDELKGIDYSVNNGDIASCSFTLEFGKTFAWYAVANDSKLEKQSDIWYFTTKQRPPENEKPVANPGGPYTKGVDQVVEFDASESKDPDGRIDFYRWNFGDGTSEILDISPTHSYVEADTYEVTLTVIDDNGSSDMATTTVTISDSTFNQEPVANVGGPYSGNVDNIVSFNGSSSYDNDGAISSYSWDFGDGSSGTGQTTMHIYTSEGNYTVTLTVTDNDGSTDTASNTVVISPLSGGGIPGFEIIFVIISIGLILILKRRRK